MPTADRFAHVIGAQRGGGLRSHVPDHPAVPSGECRIDLTPAKAPDGGRDAALQDLQTHAAHVRQLAADAQRLHDGGFQLRRVGRRFAAVKHFLSHPAAVAATQRLGLESDLTDRWLFHTDP